MVIARLQEQGKLFSSRMGGNGLSESSVSADSAGDSSTRFQQSKKDSWASLLA